MPLFVLEHTAKKKIKRLTVDADRILIGRSPRAEIPLADTGVSKEHALIERSGDGFVFVDLNSSNGTIHNGQRKKRGTLAHEDVLLVGRIRITVLLDTDEKSKDLVPDPPQAGEAELPTPLFAGDEDPAASLPDIGVPDSTTSTTASADAPIAPIERAIPVSATPKRASRMVALAILALIGVGLGAAFFSEVFSKRDGDEPDTAARDTGDGEADPEASAPVTSPTGDRAGTPEENVSGVVARAPAIVPVKFPGLVEDPAGAYADGAESLRTLYRLFLDVLRRPPTRAELEEWGDRDHIDRWRFLTRMRGDDGRLPGIGETFLRFLSREPAQKELEAMKSWRPERFADLGLWLTSTSEYRNREFRRERDIQQLARSLVVDLLDRAPSPGELSLLEQAILEADGLADIARILSARAPARETVSTDSRDDERPDPRETWLRAETFRFLLREVSDKELTRLLEQVDSPEEDRWLRVVLASTPDYRSY